MNEKIRNLQKEIEEEKSKIARCKHVFEKPFSNPEKIMEQYGYKLVAQGSDVWGEPEGYRPTIVPRWTRRCSICGFEEHTYNQKHITSGLEPDFNNG